jgi:hypothetical protein
MTDAETRAASWLQAWDAQDTHRTGTIGDQAGADWLAGEAAALGAEVTIEEFSLDRLDPVACYLDIDDQRIEGVPVFDAPATDTEGIVGRLGRPEDDAEIYAARLPPHMVYDGRAAGLRRIVGGRGFVIICEGSGPGMALLNAEHFREPFGAPAIHVSSDVRDAMRAAARDGAPARLVSHSRRTKTQVENTVVGLKGSDPSRKPLVVMTPRSSWWQSTAERGGGIVCWLESLRALLIHPPMRDVVFTANTGHELGHTGLDEFLSRRPGWDRPGGAGWVHFGANLGAAGGVLSLLSNQDDLRTLGLAELNRAGQPPDGIPWPTNPPSGETRDIHKAGGRYLTLVGTNRWFHLPQDRWPHAVDVPAVARIAAAAARMVLALSR